MHEKFPLRLIYVNRSKADCLSFKEAIGKHPELSRVFEMDITYFRGIREAYQWLRSQNRLVLDAVDCIFLDPETVGGRSTGNLSKAINLLQGIGFGRDRIIALPDNHETEAIWIELKDKLGEAQVFQKEDALSRDGLKTLTLRLEELMAKRSSGSGETLRYDIMRMDARLEVLITKIESRHHQHVEDVISLEEALEQLRGEVRIISQTLFQGPGTATPAIVTEITELKRYSRGLDKDIGQLAETHKARIIKVEEGLQSIERLIRDQASQVHEFEHERKMKNLDYRWQLLIAFGGAAGTLLIQLLIRVLTNG